MSNYKNINFDEFCKKTSIVGNALRSQYNFGEQRIKSLNNEKLVRVSECKHSR
jgi:hypothetical protein